MISWVLHFHSTHLDTRRCVQPTVVISPSTSSVSADGGQSSTQTSSMVGTATNTVPMPTSNPVNPGNRQVAALYSDLYRQVVLYMIILDQGRLAAVDRWLPCTVTPIDRFYCT